MSKFADKQEEQQQQPRSLSFTVASYNVLADCYVRVEGQPWNAFANCPSEYLNWSDYRRERVLRTILAANADIVCLQEVTFEQRAVAVTGNKMMGKGKNTATKGNDNGSPTCEKKLAWTLPLWMDSLITEGGYELVMQGLSQKDITSNAGRNERIIGRREPTGLATLYKKHKFYEFCSSKHGSGSGSVLFLQPLLPCDRSSVTAKQVEDEDYALVVANLHLVGDPTKVDAQEKQLESGLRKIEQGVPCLPTTVKNRYIFMCGDFNSDVSSADSANGEWFARNGFDRAPTGASWAAQDQISRLDHIMFKDASLLLLERASQNSAATVTTSVDTADDEDVKVATSACVGGCVGLSISVGACVPTSDEMAAATLPLGLPSQQHPSDHLLVMTEFLLTSPPRSL